MRRVIIRCRRQIPRRTNTNLPALCLGGSFALVDFLLDDSFDRIGNSRWDTNPNMSYVRNTDVVEEKDIELSDD